MIDIHNHILEGLDDGAKTVQDSLEMARLAYATGTRHIIATPHYIPGIYETTYVEVRRKVEQFNALLKQQGVRVAIYPGQEVRLHKGISQAIRQGVVGTLNQTDYMLIELPQEGLSIELLEELDRLIDMEIKPIIAHIERYPFIQKNKKLINKLIQKKCYMQMNVNNLNQMNGKKMSKWCRELLAMECIHILASDAHSFGIRNPEIASGYTEVSNTIQRNMLIENAQYILRGSTIQYDTREISYRTSLFKRRII